jgi:hypothetical protein
MPNATVLSFSTEGMLATSSTDRIPVEPTPGIPATNQRDFTSYGDYWGNSYYWN